MAIIEPLDDCNLSSVNDFSMFGLITCGGPAESPIPESSGAGVTRLVVLNNPLGNPLTSELVNQTQLLPSELVLLYYH